MKDLKSPCVVAMCAGCVSVVFSLPSMSASCPVPECNAYPPLTFSHIGHMTNNDCALSYLYAKLYSVHYHHHIIVNQLGIL